jgi:repressor LexA
MGRRPVLTSEKVRVALQRLTALHGDAPSLEDLRRELRVGSTRTLYRYLRKLEDDGLVERRPGVVGVTLLKSDIDTNAVPIVGDVQAGSLTLAEQNIIGWLRLPRSMTGPGRQKFFLLRVRGTSMNKATVAGDTVEDGDLVLVRQQSAANSGDIVVALVDGEATVKRLVMAPGYFILKPESTDERHQPIVVEKNFRVQGKVWRVLKRGSALLHSLFDE